MFPRSRALAAAFAATLALLMSMVTAGAHAEMPKPVLELTQRSNPTQLAPGGEGTYEITVQNLGSASTTGTLTVTDELPPGVTAKYAGDGGFVWQCGSVGGQSTVTCTSNILDLTTFGPDIRPHEVAFRPLAIGVEVDAGAGGAVQNRVSVSGGGAAEDVSVRSTAIGPSSPGFGIADFSGWLVDLDGRAAHQAGSHPDFTTDIDLRTTAEPGTGFPMLPGNARYVEVDLPPGLVGNPTATPACTTAELANAEGPLCRPETQVGTFDLSTAIHIPALGQQWETPVFNVDPGRNAPARFGFNVAGVVVYIEPNVRTGGDYGVSARVKNISQTLASVDSKLTFWGVPAASAHDSRRGSPFGPDIPSHEAPSPLLTMPTSCSGSPLRVAMSTASWEHPDVWDSASFETDFDGNPILNDGCDRLPFDPGLSVEPQPAARAGGPAGLRIELTVPQSESASGLSSAHLKKAVITLPEGMSVNPSSAQGLAGCAPAQVDIHGSGPASCPLASKLGTVQVETPLLDGDLEGGIYLASQGDNPFGSTIATYLVVEGSGVVIKLAGRVETDPHTGRLTITFDDNPQLPFETLAVELKAGPRAPLTMPSNCGPATTTAVLAPWSGTAPATVSSSFEVTGGSDGCDHAGFAPKLNAGSANPVAGSFSPFIVRLTRSEGESELGAIQSLRPPKGLLASLRGVPYCPDSALAGVSGEEGTGAAQIASPACPQASQVGTTTVGAGSGPNPFYTDKGRVYLAGPYKGAPLSLAAVVPAVAGPFDLGSVVVRNALHVDPETAQIEVKSDPLPQILQGIPLDLRDVQVAIDRRDFTLNPTSCDPMEVTSTIASVSGKTASPSSRFQVANCERLAFKPKLSLRLSGAPTRRGGYPKLRAELTMPPGGANIQRAQVLLPKTEFLENAHIRTICTRVQYAAGNGGGAGCPAASIYGYAKAWTPLLDKPVEGPVYLRSSSHKLPDLVASLDGQIHIDLVGRIDAKDARIRNTFETVPDAPVSKFVLTMQGGKKGLLVNNTNLCRAKPRADVRFVGQNGKVADSTPLVRVAECGKKGR